LDLTNNNVGTNANNLGALGNRLSWTEADVDYQAAELNLAKNQFTVKLDNNGHVAGVGLILYPVYSAVSTYAKDDVVRYGTPAANYKCKANDTTGAWDPAKWELLSLDVESEFVVLADRFAVASAGGKVLPFEVDTVSGQVRIRGDLITTGSIVELNVLGERVTTEVSDLEELVALSSETQAAQLLLTQEGLTTQVQAVDTRVDGTVTAISYQAAELNLAKNQFTVKLDNNGRVAGVGLILYPVYSVASTYATGEVVRYGTPAANYMCKANGTTGAWDPAKWDLLTLNSESEFIVLADRFVVANGTSEVAPFEVDTVSGQVRIRGDLIASGTILAHSLSIGKISDVNTDLGMITAGKLQSLDETFLIDLDAKTIELTGQNNTLRLLEGGNLMVGDGNVEISSEFDCIYLAPDGGKFGHNYAKLSHEGLKYVYWNGSEHVTYNALRRIESDVATNGQVVTLPGAWRSEPRVIVSPRLIKSYHAVSKDLDQTWNLTVEMGTPVPVGDGLSQHSFVATARLQVGAAMTSVSQDKSYPNTSDATFPAALDPIDVPNNFHKVTVFLWLSSKRSNGSANTFVKRKVEWRLHYGLTSALGSTTAWQTKEIGPTLDEVRSEVELTLDTTDKDYFIALECRASDVASGETFTAENWLYQNVSPDPTPTDFGSSQTKTANFYTSPVSQNWNWPSYTVPSGYTAYEIEYQGSVDYASTQGANGRKLCALLGLDVTNNLSVTNQALSRTVAGGTLQALNMTVTCSTNPGSVALTLKSPKAIVRCRKAYAVTTPVNQARWDRYDYHRGSYDYLDAAGTLNWIAVGE
jgi:hypothetical protein